MTASAPTVEPSDDELDDYFWRSKETYDRRYEKSAAALVALEQALRVLPPMCDAEPEFLRLYAEVAKLSPADFTILWQDPRAYSWVFRTYDEVGVCATQVRRAGHGIEAPSVQSSKHILKTLLEQFKALALGGAIIGDREIAFETPLPTELPFSIPGTGDLIRGPSEIKLWGRSARGIELEAHGKRFALSLDGSADTSVSIDGDRFAIEALPLVTHKGCHIYLDPYCVRWPRLQLPEAEFILESPEEAGPEHIEVIEKGLDLVSRFAPISFEHVRARLRRFGLKSDKARGVGAVSVTELPGCIQQRHFPEPVWVFENLIHEWAHNRLFFLEEENPILEEVPGPAEFYSPWRDDPRPPLGLLHAVYVFTALLPTLLRLYQSGELSGLMKGHVLDWIIRTPVQLRIGIDEIEQHAALTPFGRRFVKHLRKCTEEVIAEVDAADLPHDAPAYILTRTTFYIPETDLDTGEPLGVRGALKQHLERWDAKGRNQHWLQTPHFSQEA